VKRARLWRCAEFFLQHYPSASSCRFDAVCIDGEALTWLRHIFSA
jgi:putative endonuclease